jgi:hypothetical protein
LVFSLVYGNFSYVKNSFINGKVNKLKMFKKSILDGILIGFIVISSNCVIDINVNEIKKMIMDLKILKNPPKDTKMILSGEDLADLFKVIVGKKFILTKKPRTDGSNAWKEFRR